MPHVSLIHSIDSIGCCASSTARPRIGRTVDVLLQVHVAREQNSGLPRRTARRASCSMATRRHTPSAVGARHVMGMASLTDDNSRIAADFSGNSKNSGTARRPLLEVATFDTISMGMSDDFGITMDAGSTMEIAQGTDIFGAREY